jgi:hypothetical protein
VKSVQKSALIQTEIMGRIVHTAEENKESDHRNLDKSISDYDGVECCGYHRTIGVVRLKPLNVQRDEKGVI